MKNKEKVNKCSSGNSKEHINSKPLIIINDEYLYIISKLDNEEWIKVKFYESIAKTNICYEYKASTLKLFKNIKPLYLCNNID